MARIDTLSQSNRQMQGAQRRTWLSEHAPQHLTQSTNLMLRALTLRDPSASRSTLVLGAGACTEVPVAALARASEELVLADYDLIALREGRAELSTETLRKRVRLVQADLSGGVSTVLARQIRAYDWQALAAQNVRAVFDAAAECLERCPIPDPPQLPDLAAHDFGLVISSLLLSQLFSYPLLDILDHIQRVAPALLEEQERHRRYQEAAQQFRIRVINAHLHLLRHLLDHGGVVALLTDIRGFAFTVYGTDHDAAHRRSLPLVPRTFPELVRANFTVIEEIQWEWLTDLPTDDRPGRGYEVMGYLLS